MWVFGRIVPILVVLVHDALAHSQAVWDDLVAPSACQGVRHVRINRHVVWLVNARLTAGC